MWPFPHHYRSEMRNNMDIHINITGGLGNQLFQYAFARNIQETTGGDIYLNIYELETYDRQRSFELNKFALNDKVFIEEKKLPWYIHRRNYASKILRNISADRYFDILAKKNCYVWYKEQFKVIPKPKENNNVYIGGYWQSAKYSEMIRKTLINELTLRKQMAEEDKAIERIIASNNSVCVHARRGDYVGTDYEVCTPEYYKKAIDFITSRVHTPTFIIFSNDIDWCKIQFKSIKSQSVFIEGKRDPVIDLHLMSCCNNFIISNSTYSWWAQYLCNDESPIVCAPLKWHKKNDNSDMYRSTWSIIDV